MKKQGIWNHDGFINVYVPRFLAEMRTNIAREYLNILYKRVMYEDKTIALVCFCNDETECHRSILAGLMKGVGVDVVNENGKPVDYSQYSKMYCKKQKPIFTLLVAGSRSFNDVITMEYVLNHVLLVKATTHDIVIVEGAAHGADALAREYAMRHGYQVKEFSAQWVINGQRDNAAGFKRNRKMHEYLKNQKERGCVCFWDGVSKGTADNFNLCKEFNTPLKIFNFKQGIFIK